MHIPLFVKSMHNQTTFIGSHFVFFHNGSAVVSVMTISKPITDRHFTGSDACHIINVYNLLQGYFCPTGTTNPQACPNGYYGNSTHVSRSIDCAPCPAGKYCAGFGLREPTGLCDAGFYCRGKAFTSVILNVLSCIMIYVRNVCLDKSLLKITARVRTA